ncbi:Uncharacterized protein HZ326_14944 [Fusarium oxysporum f. sp. albedinis]|nr:Uncharacterized protein HZ326_14944 [Fusarium oxysporum f. sp. albedinis]
MWASSQPHPQRSRIWSLLSLVLTGNMTALENARLCAREKDSNAIVRVNKYRSEREGIELYDDPKRKAVQASVESGIKWFESKGFRRLRQKSKRRKLPSTGEPGSNQDSRLCIVGGGPMAEEMLLSFERQ